MLPQLRLTGQVSNAELRLRPRSPQDTTLALPNARLCPIQGPHLSPGAQLPRALGSQDVQGAGGRTTHTRGGTRGVAVATGDALRENQRAGASGAGRACRNFVAARGHGGARRRLLASRGSVLAVGLGLCPGRGVLAWPVGGRHPVGGSVPQKVNAHLRNWRGFRSGVGSGVVGAGLVSPIVERWTRARVALGGRDRRRPPAGWPDCGSGLRGRPEDPVR